MTKQCVKSAALGQQHLSLNPGDSNTAFAVSLALANSSQISKSLSICERSLNEDPRAYCLHVLRGYLRRLESNATARSYWYQSLAQLEDLFGPFPSGNLRVDVWVANAAAAVGENEIPDKVAKRVDSLGAADGYLQYRLAHVLAEQGNAAGAISRLNKASNAGFLSIQLLDCDLTLGLRTISRMTPFLNLKESLAVRTREFRTMFESSTHEEALRETS